MNPKSNKASIPLSAPLNLSKLNTEIVSFSGWNDVNSPYYGKCLSPLYIKNNTYSSANIVFDRNQNIYSIKSTELTKNNASVLTYNSNYFTDTAVGSYLSVAFTSGSSYIGISESSTPGTFILRNANGTTTSAVAYTGAGATLCAKCKYYNGSRIYIVVYYQNNGYHYWASNGSSTFTNTIIWYKNTGTTPSIVAVSPNQIRINCAYVLNNWMISILSDSGSGISDMAYFNLTISPSSTYKSELWSFSGGPIESKVTKTTTDVGFYINIENILSSGTGYAPTLSQRKLTVSLTNAWTSPIKIYISDDAHMSSTGAIVESNLLGTIAAGNTTITSTIGDATYMDGSKYTSVNRTYVWITTTGEAPDSTQTISYSFMVPSSYYGIKTTYTSTIVSSTAKEYSRTFYGSRTITLNSIHTPDVIFDDGYFYNLGMFEYGTIRTGCIPFKCSQSTISFGTTTTISYTALSYYSWKYNSTSSNNLPRSYVKTVLDIGQGFIRIMLCTTIVSYDYKDPNTLTTDTVVCYDSASNAVLINPGVNILYRNDAGSIYQENNYRLLYTNGLPSGISYGDEDYRGTLLSEWYTVSGLFDMATSTTSAAYLNTSDNMVHIITLNTGTPTYQFIENRYIVINTSSYFNCYDTYLNKIYHYADDFNNRILAGSSSTDDIDSTSEQLNMVSAVNANYEITRVAITSIGINPQQLSLIIKDHETFISCQSPVSNNTMDVDIYYGEATSAYATYYISAKVSDTILKYANPDLKGAYSPITTSGNVMYSPSIFTEYIRSYTNNDMVLSNGTGYTLIYSGTTPILGYYLLSGLDNVSTLFIIQSIYYAIVGSKIVRLTYNNGVIASNSTVADISGMQYIGSLPDKALFFGLMNKTIYSFTGDCILSPIYEANKIESIYNTYYNTATQSIYLPTDSGLYIINTQSMFRLNATGITNIFFNGTNAAVVMGSSVLYISYYYQTDYSKVPIVLTTQFYGAGNEAVSKVDAFLIRLYNNGVQENGTLTISATTLTDGGFATDKKTFNIMARDWDSTTGTIYLRYQPKYMASVGVSLNLTSSFAISSITANYTTDTEQISRFNI